MVSEDGVEGQGGGEDARPTMTTVVVSRVGETDANDGVNECGGRWTEDSIDTTDDSVHGDKGGCLERTCVWCFWWIANAKAVDQHVDAVPHVHRPAGRVLNKNLCETETFAARTLQHERTAGGGAEAELSTLFPEPRSSTVDST